MRAITEEVPNTLLRELGPERAMELAEREPDQLNEMVREFVSGVIETGGQELAEGLKRAGSEMVARRDGGTRQANRRG
jgi:hypothetical protein